ncbi:hypothetical protein [Clostridium massiliodielmoense]|uniref:hypothetical protein n=1 Tax=Clostridium massiliodielmoense TaxID=1776385 RepID=UPI000A26BCD8|nr:hypothetical protein [Clostridium massiliodielmoense]
MKKVIKINILFLISILCMFILIGCSDNSKSFNKLDQSTKERYVGSMAEKTVKRNFKLPNSSRFHNLNITNTDKNEFKVTGTVDIKNSLGAKLRNNYTIVLDIDNKYKTEGNGGYNYHIISYDIR